ncbi:MAG TPA: DUF883 domain-containing protein [Ideonella sp.]|uniref:DUF883 family protein n=1 Tax=Ideonella sp. TaxID=1929293 RepID=UPI002E3606A7|nr:DUF883 domain-containing protein [Ideonella sp.]HEX5685130.1 DUF883 domain-containing protein [Ideonella sp.]
MTAVADAKKGLATNLRHMIDEADHMLASAADSGDQAFEAVRHQFSDQVRHMRARLDDVEDAAVHRARRAARAANQAVHEHPYGAIGVAAAVGLLVGLLAARR